MGARSGRYELKRARSQGALAIGVLTIGELAARAGLRPSAIRYYEARGLLPAPDRRSGRRIYAASALDRLAAIRLAKGAGFTVSEVRALLDGGRRRLIRAKSRELRERIAELAAAQSVLESLRDCGCRALVECGRVVRAARAERVARAVGPA